MPKDKVEEPKKKVVVVEEIEEPEENKVEEVKVEEAPVIEEEKHEVKIHSKTSSEFIPESGEDEYDRPNYLWIIIPTALLVGALVGGLITYFSGISKLDVSVVPSPISSSEPVVSAVTPTATPSSTLKRDVVKVQILNGSGVSGAAGKAKALLESLGYKTIDTGNALSSDVASTEVATTEAKKDYLDLVIDDLSEKYEASAAAKILPATSKYDIVITLGKK